jgi:hypothetical protein
MRPNETYDEWHRREFSSQYIWENYSYPDFGISDNQLVCRLPIRIFNCEDCQLIADNLQISDIHKKTIDFILENQDSFIEDIRDHIFEYYKFLWNDYLNESEDEVRYPNPNTNNKVFIDNMIKPKAVHFANRISEGYFGICFKCTFEDEHGLGIRIRNYKVEKVGGEDIGFNLHPDK